VADSQSKGKRGELDCERALVAKGWIAKRTSLAQAGGHSEADIHAILGGREFAVEVKTPARGYSPAYDALEQAQKAAENRVPLVLARQTSSKDKGRRWLVVLDLEHFTEIARGD